MLISDLLFRDIIRHMNDYVINPLLVYNYGQQAKDTVQIETSGLSDDTRTLYREIIKQVITAPGNVDLFLSLLDVNAIIENAGLPVSEEQNVTITRPTLPTESEQQMEGQEAIGAAMSHIYRHFLNRGGGNGEGK